MGSIERCDVRSVCDRFGDFRVVDFVLSASILAFSFERSIKVKRCTCDVQVEAQDACVADVGNWSFCPANQCSIILSARL